METFFIFYYIKILCINIVQLSSEQEAFRLGTNGEVLNEYSEYKIES